MLEANQINSNLIEISFRTNKKEKPSLKTRKKPQIETFSPTDKKKSAKRPQFGRQKANINAKHDESLHGEEMNKASFPTRKKER